MKNIVLMILCLPLFFLTGCGGGSSPYIDNGVSVILNNVKPTDFIRSDPNDAYKESLNPPSVTSTSSQTSSTSSNNAYSTTTATSSSYGTAHSTDDFPNTPQPTYNAYWAKGYFRKNGTYVRGHWRTPADGIVENNLGTTGFKTYNN